MNDFLQSLALKCDSLGGKKFAKPPANLVKPVL
jgi:hypothetical protein